LHSGVNNRNQKNRHDNSHFKGMSTEPV